MRFAKSIALLSCLIILSGCVVINGRIIFFGNVDRDRRYDGYDPIPNSAIELAEPALNGSLEAGI